MAWNVSLLSGLAASLIALSATVAMYGNSTAIHACGSKKCERICFSIMLYAVSWSVASSLWLVSSHFFRDSEVFITFSFVTFALPPFFVFLACLMFLLAIRERLDMKQFAIDVLIMTTVLWILAVGIIETAGGVHFFQVAPLLLLFIFLDLFSIILVLSAYVSLRKSKNRACVNVIILGLFAFSVIDFVFITQTIVGRYTEYGVVYLLYTLPLFLFVWASEVIKAIVQAKRSLFWDEKAEKGDLPDNYGRSYLPAGLLVFGIYLYIIRLIPQGMMVAVLVLLVVYFLVSLFYQETLKSKFLLRFQLDQNRILESKVQERTAELAQKNEELEKIVNVDPLTKLLSRRYFAEKLTNLYKSETKTPSTLIVIDLLKFKNFNSMMGSLTADAFLVETADRLRRRYGAEHEIFRIEGNEFALWIPELEDAHRAIGIAREINDLLREPFGYHSFSLKVSPAFGISMYPKNTAFLGDLLKNGEISVREAKQIDGDFKCVLYNEQLHSYAKRRMQIQSLLETINFEEEFELYYQPQYSVDGGRLKGMEALLRWHSGIFGAVSPGEFIPIAEESNAVARIVDWTMENAFLQIRRWKETCGEAADGLRVGVNVSPKYIGAIDFASRVKNLVKKTDIRPEWVDIEITERSILNLEPSVVRAFDELSSLGITVSIDDFGAGYSPLSYLRKIRVSTLKIAKELVDGMTPCPDGEALVRAVIMMAKELGIKTMAEGVETAEQAEKLQSFGCDGIQGYYFGRPMPVGEFEARHLSLPLSLHS